LAWPDVPGWIWQSKQALLFEKSSKNFFQRGLLGQRRPAANKPRDSPAKVFWFFFSKKNPFA
jgi:hypothetical protein